MLVKNKMAEIFRQRILDAYNVPKHIKVRKNPKERAKLEYIDKELRNSPRLKDVE